MEDKLSHASAILRILERERIIEMKEAKLYLGQGRNISPDSVYLEQSPSRDERQTPGRSSTPDQACRANSPDE